MDQVEPGGGRFRTDVAGHGDEWLLLHELGGSLESWTPAVPELAKHSGCCARIRAGQANPKSCAAILQSTRW